MSKRSVPRAGKAQSRRPFPATGPIRHVPGKGLMVNTQPGPFPVTAEEKIICAKSIVQAVVAAHDAQSLDDENYDIHFPLSLAVQLLNDAERRLEVEQKGGAA